MLFCLVVLCTLPSGCGGHAAEEKDDHVEYLEIGETWTVDGQWELTVLRVFHMASNDANATVQYQLTNINCSVVTEGYKGLVMTPRVYGSMDMENEYKFKGIDAWPSKPGTTIKKNRCSVSSADEVTPIDHCYIVFSQTADDGVTYTAVYEATL